MITISLIAQIHYIINIVNEVSSALNIRIFIVKDKATIPLVREATDDFEAMKEEN